MTNTENEICLEMSNVTVRYGKLEALSGVTVHVRKQDIVAILGPNAAGKTTLVSAISGMLAIVTGSIIFDGLQISGLVTEEIVNLGISLVPEGRLLFPKMKVLENLELGAYRWRSKRNRKETKERIEKIFDLFPVLKERKRQMAGTLSGGQQQMVAIGRGLMSDPQLLLLDEPSLGLAPILVTELMKTLLRLKNEMGLTVLLSEQNAVAALDIADRAFVINSGKIVISGRSDEMKSSDIIRDAYLGSAV